MMAKRVVVLGARGYLGRSVVSATRKSGHVTTAAIRARAGVNCGESEVMCDATDFAELLHVVEGADVVVNAIAGVPRDIVAVANHLGALLQQDIFGRIIHISSLSIYGQAHGILHEGTMPTPSRGHQYSIAKTQAETLIAAKQRAFRRHVILRPGCIYGPGAPVWVDRIARLLRDRHLGDLGDQGRGAAQLIHVADLASIVASAVDQDVFGTFNIISTEYITWNDYFARLAKLTGAFPLRQFTHTALEVRTLIDSAARLLVGQLTNSPADYVTSTMLRLFRNQAHIVSIRKPIIDPMQYRSFDDGTSEAARAFLRQRPGLSGALAARCLAEPVRCDV